MKRLNITIVALASIFTAVFVSCGNGTTNDEPVTYSGTSGDTNYSLTISPPESSRAVRVGDDYMLVVRRGGSEKTSAGMVKEVKKNEFVLQPSVENAPTFSVATSGKSIANISDTITYADKTRETGPGIVHDWGKWTVVTAATCTSDGVESRVCLLDPTHIETRDIAALGHKWGEWKQIKTGEATRACANDSSHTETLTMPSGGGVVMGLPYTKLEILNEWMGGEEFGGEAKTYFLSVPYSEALRILTQRLGSPGPWDTGLQGRFDASIIIPLGNWVAFQDCSIMKDYRLVYGNRNSSTIGSGRIAGVSWDK